MNYNRFAFLLLFFLSKLNAMDVPESNYAPNRCDQLRRDLKQFEKTENSLRELVQYLAQDYPGILVAAAALAGPGILIKYASHSTSHSLTKLEYEKLCDCKKNSKSESDKQN